MKGFTLLESVVTIAVISIIAVVVLANYGTLRSRTFLDKAVQKIALDIRKAQNFAVVTVRLPDGTIPCGYGIHYVDNDTYALFANIQDGALDDCSDSNKIYDGGDIIVETINIQQPKIRFNGALSPFSDILFFPPDPVTFINGVFNSSARSTIGLCFEDDCASMNRQIDVWGTGLVDIE